jgi:hypothetical protein
MAVAALTLHIFYEKLHIMKERTIVSASALAVSLLAYLYAKNAEKDSVPFVMIGGFAGALIGEVIAENKKKKNGC